MENESITILATIPFTKPEVVLDVTNSTAFLKKQANVVNPKPVFIIGANLVVLHESILVVVKESRLIRVVVKPHLLTFGGVFYMKYPVSF